MIDRKRYVLLVTLFAELSQRGETRTSLGLDPAALKFLKWLLLAGMTLFACFASGWPVLLAASVFVMGTVLIAEVHTSLLNPVEALVLAHQPIDGRTYVAAKLTHLIKVIGMLVISLGVGPAFILPLRGKADWSHPAFYMALITATALVLGLFCCGLYGLLLRWIPANRLQAAGQSLSVLPLAGFYLREPLWDLARYAGLDRFFPLPPAVLAVLAILVLATAALGLRALSADYLLRASSIARKTSGGGNTGGRGIWFRRDAPALAGFVLMRRMMRRDPIYRRRMGQALMPLAGLLAPLLRADYPVHPLSGQFHAFHMLPHILGSLMPILCSILEQSNEHKASWIYQTVPSRAFGGFARGVYGALWTTHVLVPYALAAPVLLWFWPSHVAVAFLAYGVAVSSLYLILSLPLLESLPFTRQVSTESRFGVFAAFMGSVVIAAAGATLQHYLIFTSMTRLILVAAAAAVAAIWLTRQGVDQLAGVFRFQVHSETGLTAKLYSETN